MRDFTCLDPPSSSVSQQARRALVVTGRDELRCIDDRVSLAPHHQAARAFSFLGECGEAACALNRMKDPSVRNRFAQLVVAHTLAAAGGRPIRYASLASGHLLMDASILSQLTECGAQLEAVLLCDAEYANPDGGCDSALAQLAHAFAPAKVVAFNSVPNLVEAVLRGYVSADVTGVGTVHCVVACDAGVEASRMLKRASSLILADGGAALTLMNGGHAGATTRGWLREKRLPGVSPVIPPSLDIKLAPATNGELGLEELALPPAGESTSGDDS